MDKLYKLIRDKLNLSQDTMLTDDMSIDDVSGWDSFGWVTILNEIQDKYNISISLDEAADIRTIGDIQKLIRKKCSSE